VPAAATAMTAWATVPVSSYNDCNSNYKNTIHTKVAISQQQELVAKAVAAVATAQGIASRGDSKT